ncbi:MAG: hypoxanthine phosphoribosyltransferase [Caldithrix sp.]|nr:hypoxanthine phosphoribosyltransferase [Caldithrix sp.]
MLEEFNQSTLIPENYELLITHEEIQKRLFELGKNIAKDYEGQKPILIGVLNGAFVLLSDLMRYINIDLEIDFIRISSYGDGKESSGHIKVLKPLSADIKDRAVIVIEDIVDSGLSVQFLENMLSAFSPKSLKFLTLLQKPEKKIVDINIDYVGFNIDDQFVVGYGLDDQQIKRNLRDIYAIFG